MSAKIRSYNEYQIRALLEKDNVDFNNFYKDDLVRFLEIARKELQTLKMAKCEAFACRYRITK